MAALMKFDTLGEAKKLKEAGVPSKQAEAQVELIFKTIDDNICTKQDLRELETNTKIRLKELEFKTEELRKDLAVSIEKVNSSIERIKASLSRQIARWVLGVSAF